MSGTDMVSPSGVAIPGDPAARPSGDTGPIGPRLPRRERPSVLAVLDGSPAAYEALLWALREAVRRDAAVLAVGILDPAGSDDRVAAAVAADLARAEEETGVHGIAHTSVLEPAVLDVLVGAARGGDLVLVGARGKALLRRTTGRPAPRLVHRA